MKEIHGVDLIGSSQEERLPDYSFDFPYVATRAHLQSYGQQLVPWHMHSAAEMTYLEAGALDYYTPDGICHMQQGDCLLIMPSTLHKTNWNRDARTVQMIHMVDPMLLFGASSGRVARKFVRPLMGNAARKALLLRGNEAQNREAIDCILSAFALDDKAFDYECVLREKLTRAWLAFVARYGEEDVALPETERDEDIRKMLRYIEENCDKQLSVEDVAAVVHRSARVCYRLFREQLHVSPTEYLTQCRMRLACRLLTETAQSVSQIALHCGFSSPSYFSKVFHDTTGCSAKDFRQMAQNQQHLTQN